ncbi:hypothetical protein [Natranaerobius trueperi]|uniref:hypothetical protein n=1 Tax=Natranaerobius trueperi TaxID=759412 RepID=UPI00197B22CC|nr:hypothetical protein [Natranaerobius trueperi]
MKKLDFNRTKNQNTIVTTSVCIGALLLANSGLLNGKKAPTHHKSFDQLESFDEITVIKDQKFVDKKILLPLVESLLV